MFEVTHLYLIRVVGASLVGDILREENYPDAQVNPFPNLYDGTRAGARACAHTRTHTGARMHTQAQAYPRKRAHTKRNTRS